MAPVTALAELALATETASVAAAEAALRSGVAKERGVARGGGAASTRNDGSSCRHKDYT